MVTVISEDYYDGLQAMLGNIDEYAFGVCEYLTNYWDEMSIAITSAKQKEFGWSDAEAEGKAHRWWLASSAAKVGASENTLYKYKRIGDNILARGYRLGNENLTIDHWSHLMLNAERDDTGLIPAEILEERLEWLHQETVDNYGQVPSTRDIKAHYRKNGHKEEWEQYKNILVRNANKLLDCVHAPDHWQVISTEILMLDEEDA